MRLSDDWRSALARRTSSAAVRALAAATADLRRCLVPPACASLDADRSLLRPPEPAALTGRLLLAPVGVFLRVFLRVASPRLRPVLFRTAL